MERRIAAIDCPRGVLILLDHGAIQTDSGEHPLGARVSEDLAVHLPVGAGGRVAANGASRSGGIAAHLEFARQQVLQAMVVHNEHYKIHAFNANLQSPAASTDGDECRCAPAFLGTAGGNAAAVLPTDHESSLD